MGVPEGAKMGAIGGLVGGKDGGGGRAASPAGGRRQSSRVFKGGERANMMLAKAKTGTMRAAIEEDDGSISTLGSKDPTHKGRQPKPPSAQPSQASHHSSARGGGGGVRRASLEGGARRSSMQGGSPAGSRPRTTDSNGEVRRGSYGLSGKLQGSLRMANRRLSFAFGNAMTLKVESRSTNLCRCPATNPWTQLMSAHDGTTVGVMKQHVVGSLGKLGRKAPVELQVLSYRGAELHDDKTMRHYKIRDGAKLVLTFKPCSDDKAELRLGYLQHRFPGLRDGGDAAPALDPEDPASPRLDCSAAWSRHTAPEGKLRWRFPGFGLAKAPRPPSVSTSTPKPVWPATAFGLLENQSESSFETVVTPTLGQSNVAGSLVARNKPRPPPKRASMRASFNRNAQKRASQRAGKADEGPE